MNLGRIQFFSLFSKAVTTALGIAQSVIVIRILSPAEYGLVGLVMSVGGIVGVTQHLGVVDGTIREIAVRRSKSEAGKVFWVSILVRQLVTIPLSVALILLAQLIAVRIYGKPEIGILLQIFAASLILQGFQDVLGATLTGLKRFYELYAVQIITAAINIAVFGVLTWKFGMAGFFWAIVITTSIMVAIFSFLVVKRLGPAIKELVLDDIKKYSRQIMRIGAYMYVSRIFFIVWQRLPILMLGGVLAADQLGYLNVSQTFGSKLTIIAMALSEVNLSWMSTLYEREKDKFRQVVTKNMHRVMIIMTVMALVLVFYVPEILQYVVGSEYLPARPIILVMTAAFYLYALCDIGTSSVFVPANKPRVRTYVYGVMTTVAAGIIGFVFVIKPDSFWAAVGVLVGALISYSLMVVIAKTRFGVSLLTKELMFILLLFSLSLSWLLLEPSLVLRTVVFLAFLTYLSVEVFKNNIFPRELLKKLFKSNLGRNKGGNKEIKIVCFAGAAFNSPYWTNRQQIMSRLARKYKVYYVEPRVWIVKYVLKNIGAPKKILGFLQRIVWYQKKGNLYIKAQWNLIPKSREYSFVSVINHWLNRWNVLLVLRAVGFTPKRNRLLVWIYDTEAAEYLSSFEKSFVVYDCVDDHEAQVAISRDARRIKDEEKLIMERADLVTVTSVNLKKRKKRWKDKVHLVLNAGDVKMFKRTGQTKPSLLKDINGPIIGTIGTLDDYKFDFRLIEKAAKRRPDWNFVLGGSPMVNSDNALVESLKKLPNVYVTGVIDRTEAPNYVNNFDVCIIPYKENRYNRSSFPLKFWEFMATGKPIVVSGLPELQRYKGLVGYAYGVDQFVKMISRWLNNPARAKGERVELAQKHSWEDRVSELMSLVNKYI
jgi:O-antigen/teichoic acid export membrane protein